MVKDKKMIKRAKGPGDKPKKKEETRPLSEAELSKLRKGTGVNFTTDAANNSR